MEPPHSDSPTHQAAVEGVRSLNVFLCHSSKDKPSVRRLYHRLRAEGIDVWLDEKKLLPGQDWQFEIGTAVRNSDVVIVCLSSSSVSKEGFVQKEIKIALDIADEKPEGTIFIIPVRLDECAVPDRLRRWQWVDFFEDEGYSRLMAALSVRARSLGISLGSGMLDLRREHTWITIEAGKLWLGAQSQDPSRPNYDPLAQTDELPVHETCTTAFQIRRYCVTVKEFGRFLEEDGYSKPQWWNAGGFAEASQPRDWDDQIVFPTRPVVGVSWHEAAAYCAWAQMRLPTEAEWERAARGIEGRRYPWGDDEPDATKANYQKMLGHPASVGSYPRGATPDGIEDLAGNVWEWVADWYQHDYRESPHNAKSIQSGNDRVIRGGCWFSQPPRLRSSARDRSDPAQGNDIIGFRGVRDLAS